MECMTKDQREEALAFRQRHHRPWHSPPHFVGESSLYLVSAACYEHHPVIGASPQRMAVFESDLLDALRPLVSQIFAWIVLPNHYHVVVHTPDIGGLLKSLGRFHGTTSFRWNGEDTSRGRQVWRSAAETR